MAGTYLDSIKSFKDIYTRGTLIFGCARGVSVKSTPAEFDWLKPAITIFFDRLGLPRKEWHKILLAFITNGVIIPNTSLHLKTIRQNWVEIQPQDGTETATLPPNWEQSIVVWGKDKPTWIGKNAHDTILTTYARRSDPNTS